MLINNAGIFASLTKRKFELIEQAEWDLVMRVNINGMIRARSVAPVMRKVGWGRIINIASDAVPRGVMNYLHDVISKSAMIGMTNAMARELAEDGISDDGMNVNCIRPGSVATEADRAVNPMVDLRKMQIAQQCIKRGMEPPDLAGVMIFLSSAASSFITGQTIACDGG